MADIDFQGYRNKGQAQRDGPDEVGVLWHQPGYRTIEMVVAYTMMG